MSSFFLVNFNQNVSIIHNAKPLLPPAIYKYTQNQFSHTHILGAGDRRFTPSADRNKDVVLSELATMFDEQQRVADGAADADLGRPGRAHLLRATGQPGQVLPVRLRGRVPGHALYIH